MPYLIYAIDYSAMNPQREAVRDQHRQHLRSVGDRLLASGALLAEDGVTIIGGISLLDTESYDEAAAFAYNDPYTKVGIRKDIQIIKWRKRWWEGDFLGEPSD